MNKQKGFSTLYGIIILLVIGGGIYWYINNVNPKVLPLEVETNQPTENNAEENNEAEIFNFQPGNVLSVKEINEDLWLLEVDLLTYNTEWMPGSASIPKYLNQNPKIRQLYINKSTKIYNCDWNYKTESYNFDYNQKDEVEKIERMVLRYKEEGYEGFWMGTFSIAGSVITAVHQQCAG